MFQFLNLFSQDSTVSRLTIGRQQVVQCLDKNPHVRAKGLLCGSIDGEKIIVDKIIEP